jgi:hypothetical protein
MSYTFEQLKEDVRKEAEALKVHATKEELAKLDFDKLDPQSPSECYYGQMTGSCASSRAHTLIAKCCSVMVVNAGYEPEGVGVASIMTKKPVSKSYMRQIRDDGDNITYLKYISAMEAYIMLPEAKNANLIAFLRGETETLEL